MIALLRDLGVLDHDILAIEEPWKNPIAETTNHPTKSAVYLCYPKTGEDGPVRVCLFTNKRLDHTK